MPRRPEPQPTGLRVVLRLFETAARADRAALVATRVGLVVVLVSIGSHELMIALHPWLPQVAAVGSVPLVSVMSLVTLSFLITKPECWVPALGSPEHGFRLLSGAGRLVVKAAIMLGAALVTMADSAKAYLRKRAAAPLAQVSERELHPRMLSGTGAPGVASAGRRC